MGPSKEVFWQLCLVHIISFQAKTKCNKNSIKSSEASKTFFTFSFLIPDEELFETVDAGVTFQRMNKTEAALQLPFLEKVVAMLFHFNKSTKPAALSRNGWRDISCQSTSLSNMTEIKFYADLSLRVLKVRDQTRLPRYEFIFYIVYIFFIFYIVIFF